MYKRWHLHGKTLGNERHRLSNGQWLINYWLTASAGQEGRGMDWPLCIRQYNLHERKFFDPRIVTNWSIFGRKSCFELSSRSLEEILILKLKGKESETRLLIAMQSVSVRYTVSILNRRRRRRRRRKITIIKTRRGRRKIKTEKTKIPVVSVTTSFHF